MQSASQVIPQGRSIAVITGGVHATFVVSSSSATAFGILRARSVVGERDKVQNMFARKREL